MVSDETCDLRPYLLTILISCKITFVWNRYGISAHIKLKGIVYQSIYYLEWAIDY